MGYAIYFWTFSTWQGRTLYLEDLYVKESARGKGVGREMLKTCARIADDNGAARYMDECFVLLVV